jgi:hypothetical protein
MAWPSKPWFAVPLGPASIASALLCVGALHACGSNGGDAGPGTDDDSGATDTRIAEDTARPDTNVGTPATCVKSRPAAPFATTGCLSPKPAVADSFDEALGLAGLDRCKLVLDRKQVPASGWNIADPRRLPDYEPLLLVPLRLPAYGTEMAGWLDEAIAGKNPISAALVAASQRRGAPIDACADEGWYVVDGSDEAPLATVLGELAVVWGADFDLDAVKASVSTVPLPLQQALVPVVRAIGNGAATVRDARKTTDGKTINTFLAMSSWLIGSRNVSLTKEYLAALDAVDVTAMTQAAVFVSTAIEHADLTRFAGLAVNVELDTPFGPLVLHGAGSDKYLPGSKAETAALVIDTGGNDEYRVAVAASSLTTPISVAIDLGGDDLYAYVEKKVAADDVGTRLPSDSAGRGTVTRSRFGRQGSGVLGVGLLADLGAGKDRYRSLAVSQGVGVLGVGVLYDDGGNDDYASEAYSQGAAGWGIGLLLDGGGNDLYRAYTQAQGLGSTQGFAALVDENGDDVYFTDPGDPAIEFTRFDGAIGHGDTLYPSPQLPDKGNTSMSQGCGQGRRSDTVPEGIGFLGGMGLLRDAGNGKDRYTTSVFGQGCGFMGAGFLLDGGGDDVYEGLWYVQGADAHLGIAYLNDKAGNDHYDPTFPIAATSIGVGHDFSVALHYDEAGDDTYKGPGLALGSGWDNGIGILVNVGGSDSFSAAGNPSLGGAGVDDGIKASSRMKLPTYGVFTKAGGSATYSVAGAVDPTRISGQWSYAPENTPDGGVDGGPVIDSEKSSGVDRPTGTASLP